MTDERDLLDDDGDEGEDSADDSSSDESAPAKDSKSPDKRISALQSARDKETARANKAEKQLKALLDAAKDPDAEVEPPPTAGGGGGGAVDAATLDMARMFAFQRHPKLEEYGIAATDLTGSTPSEIVQSAAGLTAQFEMVETKVRNKVLAENGLAPEISSGAPPPAPRDFSKMSSEDFKKLVDQSMKG